MPPEVMPPRRRAVQARSRATVERILESAAALIAERGAEGVTMTEIARRADVVIGSLYQYFPDKAGVMTALFEQHSAGVHAMLMGAIDGSKDLEDLTGRVADLAERYFELHREDALFRGLWSAVQTDPALQALDVEDSLKNARALFAVARPLYRRVDEERLLTACALGMQLSLAAARFALALPQPMQTLAAPVFAHMLRDAFLGLEEG